MMIHAIHHVQATIPRDEEAQARRFYCDILRLVEIPKPASLAGRGGLWLAVGDRQLHIGVEDGVERSRSKAHIAYEVRDLAEMIAWLDEHDVPVQEAPEIPGFARTQLRDPFGNLIELIQPLSATVPARQRIEGTRVVLVPHETALAEELYAAVRESIPELSQWMTWCHPGYQLSQTQDWVAAQPASWSAGSACEFVIIDSQSGGVIGACGINLINRADRYANLGYWIRKSKTGHGYATEAARLAADFGFRELNLHRVEIVAASGNHASRRVAEKLGAFHEGTLRNRIVVHDTVHDAELFSLIPDNPA